MMAPEEHEISNKEAKEIAEALAKVMEGKSVRFRDPDNGWKRDVSPTPRDTGGMKVRDFAGIGATIFSMLVIFFSASSYMGSKFTELDGKLGAIPKMQADISDIKDDQSTFMRELVELRVRFSMHEQAQKIREEKQDAQP